MKMRTNISKYYYLVILLIYAKFIDGIKSKLDSCHCTEYPDFGEMQKNSQFNDNPVHCSCQKSIVQLSNQQNYSFLTLSKFENERLDTEFFYNVNENINDLVLVQFENLITIEENSLDKFKHLKTLEISTIPHLLYLSLNILNITTCQLTYLTIRKTGLKRVPFINLPDRQLKSIDMAHNEIEIIESNSLSISAEIVMFSHNKISMIQPWAFNNSQIYEIQLIGNYKLETIPENAFSGLTSLKIINLSRTSITNIPTSDMRELEVLVILQTYSLKIIPSIYDFPNLRKADLTFYTHCCAFHLPERHDPQRASSFREHQAKMKSLCDQSQLLNDPLIISKSNFLVNHSLPDNGDDDVWSDEIDTKTNNGIWDIKKCTDLQKEPAKPECYPQPDAFNPCEDIMSYWLLRIVIWLVILMAFLGNICVLSVIISKLKDLTVAKFLICNLAFADLCMAWYLLIIGVKDLLSRGYYFNHAYDWQMGIGCSIAGFFSVFASQLSIYILGLLTIERWFSIKRALYFNEFTFKNAVLLTIGGWSYSIVMASLPLFGVSSYSATSLCLPMNISKSIDMVYILVMLVFASLTFILICVCYHQIYFSININTRRNSNGEYTLAKKMIILVGTNFVCWAPVTFFALTALFGFPLISITNSKILLVFIYPLNSCANPFMYGILTHNFKKDFINMVAKFGCKFNASSIQEYGKVYYKSRKNEVVVRHNTSETCL